MSGYIPQLLTSPDLGLFLSVQVGRKWSHIIARDASAVYVKKVRNEVVERAKIVEYPKGLVVAAEHFLKPALGVAQVTEDAKLILEEIMKEYSTKAAAKRGLERMGGDVSKLDEIVKQVDGKWQLDDSKVEKPLKISSKKRLEKVEAKAAPKKAEKAAPTPRGTGKVAAVHAFCERFRKSLESGKLTRGDAIKQMMAEGIVGGTAQVQIGVWAKANNITLTRASRAAA